MVKVKVYSTPTCPYCTKVKEFLKEHKIKFEEINVAENKEEAEKMVEKSGQMSVPVIEVGNTIIVGFDRDALKKALGIKE